MYVSINRIIDPILGPNQGPLFKLWMDKYFPPLQSIPPKYTCSIGSGKSGHAYVKNTFCKPFLLKED